ncbi:MAG TPA: HAMP domain-containing sensor histidine kinase [Streptosporangiaceae bacterium]|nr:HAMP domain-containing sensor histidine kinase [Streptosporangiaceae bacterium]
MTLNARLMTGLLAVTGLGLLVMGLVSALVLHSYLMHRVDAQLRAARDRAVVRLLQPGLPAQGVAPARYVILTVTPAGAIRTPTADRDSRLGPGSRPGPGSGSGSGLDPDPAKAIERVRALGLPDLRARAASGEPFSLGGGLRAIARPGGIRAAGGNIVVVATPLAEINGAVRRLIAAELVTGGVLIGLLTLLGRRLIGRGLAPLDRMASTAHGIATGGDLRARMPGGDSRTEVGRLAAAINVMLDRIAEAFLARTRSEARVRDFAADASHELRTPLTTIKGYAELYRQGALDDLPDAMRRIEEEAGRMSLLVGDLLELARLDRGSSLELAPVDLTELARDAVADASVAAPGRAFDLDAPDSLPAVADEARIRQVLANLLANVTAHTAGGAVVRLGSSPGGVFIEVADDGPGMSEADAARAFDRFHRAGRTSRGGAGLGLSIVAAIAAAHGGRATLSSAPGAGTTVRVELPPTHGYN